MKVLKLKWFWVGFLILFLLAITSDITLMFVSLKNLITGELDPYLVILGAFSALLGAVGARDKVFESEYLRRVGLLLYIIAIWWVFKDYGFRDGMLFMIGIFVVNKLLKWILPNRERLRILD